MCNHGGEAGPLFLLRNFLRCFIEMVRFELILRLRNLRIFFIGIRPQEICDRQQIPQMKKSKKGQNAAAHAKDRQAFARRCGHMTHAGLTEMAVAVSLDPA
jgi:hypothetical protein